MKLDGANVVDAKKSVRITILPKDINGGSTKDPHQCALARACKRVLHVEDSRIHLGRCYLKMSGKWQRFRTSAALRNEIIAFDRGGAFAPGEYTLKTIPRKDEGIKRTKPKGTKDKRVKLKRQIRHIVAGVRDHGPLGRPSAQ